MFLGNLFVLRKLYNLKYEGAEVFTCEVYCYDLEEFRRTNIKNTKSPKLFSQRTQRFYYRNVRC